MLLNGYDLGLGGAVSAGNQHFVPHSQRLVVGAVVVHPLPPGEPHPAEGVHGLVRGRQRVGVLGRLGRRPGTPPLDALGHLFFPLGKQPLGALVGEALQDGEHRPLQGLPGLRVPGLWHVVEDALYQLLVPHALAVGVLQSGLQQGGRLVLPPMGQGIGEVPAHVGEFRARLQQTAAEVTVLAKFLQGDFPELWREPERQERPLKGIQTPSMYWG